MKIGDRVVFRKGVPVHNEGRPNRHVGCVFRVIPSEYFRGDPWLLLKHTCPAHNHREDGDYRGHRATLPGPGQTWEASPSHLRVVGPVR